MLFGDIKKVYSSVLVKDQEVHLHRFPWHHTEEEELGMNTANTQ